MKLHAVFFCIASLFITVSCGKAQEELPPDVKQQTQKRIDDGYHLGTVIGVLDENGAHYYGFGSLSPDSQKTPDKETIFEIGSVTKTFTAALAADLEKAGYINLGAPVHDYLPVFEDTLSSSDQPVSLAELMTHTSGLPREPDNMDANDDDRYKNYSVDDLNEFLSSYKIQAGDTRYQYSNVGILVLEHALETTMNQTYEDLLEQNIINTIGMPNTHFDVPDHKRDKLAAGYRAGALVSETDLGSWQSMGGLRSTAEDMLQYLGAQMGVYPTPLEGVFKETHKERFSNNEIAMGLGWQIMKRDESGKTIYYHKGGTNGFVSFAGFDPETKTAVVVLVNGTRWFSDLGFRLLDPTYPLSDPQ